MLAFLQLAALLPYHAYAASIPANATSAAVSVPGFIPHAVPTDTNRSLFTIVWGCIATLFACAWVAVHPDISGLDDGPIDRFFHRVKLLVWVLICPEAIVVWAWRQHRGAQALRYKYNDPGNTPYSATWNLVHAHFLQMGGFVLCTDINDEQTRSILRPDKLSDLAKSNAIDFPKHIKPEDITDRSKGDGFTYLVAISQLVWFATQCIARAVAGLSITIFELVSISFVPITVIMYCLWWPKPQNAQTPIVIMWNPQPMARPRKERSVSQDAQTIVNSPEEEKTSNLEMPYSEYGGDDAETMSTMNRKDKLLWFPFSLFQRAIRTFEDMLGTTSRSQRVPTGSRRLPAFYAYPHEHNPENISKTPLIMGSLMGSIFGVVHVAGWNIKFVTPLEQTLWRCSSAVIVVVPLFTVLNIFVARRVLHPSENKGGAYVWLVLPVMKFGFALLAGILTLSYIIARIILFVVMCTSLRALPPSQRRDITWVTDIPHIL